MSSTRSAADQASDDNAVKAWRTALAWTTSYSLSAMRSPSH